MFRPDRPLSGYAEVADYLRREISLGRLVPGDKLPAERRLAESLGVARETVRQALRVLEGGGQIVISRGAAGGATVTDNSLPPEVAIHELRRQRGALLSLIEFRGELETIAAGLAAERRTQDHLDEMRRSQEALRSASNKDESRRADTAFHLAVARAAGNPHLASVIESSRASMFHSVDLVDFTFIKDTSHAEHQHVLDTVAARDGKAASVAMRRHIASSRAEMLRLIDDEPDPGPPPGPAMRAV